MIRPLCIATAAVLASIGIAVAHPPGADGRHDDHHQADPSKIRAWTNAKTGEVVRGAFLTARTVDEAVRVSMERENGDVVVFPLADLAEVDRAEAQKRIDEIRATNERLADQAVAQTARAAQPPDKPDAPLQALPFNAFAPFVTTRWDDRWLYVESDGLPHAPGSTPGTFVYSHTPMVGITAWQQQVPLPQRYTGRNAWQIPLKPEFADQPVSAREQLFRGAIALAANGVPIFNPIKNDGRTDTFLAGELDEFGGHCGRADDYHYHLPPTHLQKYVGAGQPIAYALDGFPIYGFFDASAKAGDEKACPLGGTEKLDELNGHHGATTKGPGDDGVSTVAVPGLYHYHASAKYPYLNGGMRGVVTVSDDQIDPQPQAHSPREALQPLRGAKITGFKHLAGKSWSLEYTLAGKKHLVNFRIEDGGEAMQDATIIFEYVDPSGAAKTKTYDATSQPRRPGGEGRREDRERGRRPREEGDRPPPPRDDRPPRGNPPAVPGGEPDVGSPSLPVAGFELASQDVADGRLSIDCTCDGASRSPALSWTKPPTGTKALAIVMHHITRDNDTHTYMVIANIPASVHELQGGDGPERGAGERRAAGTWGQNTVNRRNEYAPPCSQGPGDKTYTITLYALSSEASLPEDKPLTRGALLTAIKDTTLATATLDVKYARDAGGGGARGGR